MYSAMDRAPRLVGSDDGVRVDASGLSEALE
jgi:hypothetical protein